ncbi:MAG: zinc ribbon domain-containing protein [Bacteroidota bacterium]
MATKECPSCAMNVDDKSTVCPICGYEFPVRNRGFVFVAILLLIVVVLYFIF